MSIYKHIKNYHSIPKGPVRAKRFYNSVSRSPGPLFLDKSDVFFNTGRAIVEVVEDKVDINLGTGLSYLSNLSISNFFVLPKDNLDLLAF